MKWSRGRYQRWRRHRDTGTDGVAQSARHRHWDYFQERACAKRLQLFTHSLHFLSPGRADALEPKYLQVLMC